MNVLAVTPKVCRRCHELWRPVAQTKSRICQPCRDELATAPKRCNKCGVEKTLDQYYVSRTDLTGRQSICIECMRERDRQVYRDRIGHAPRPWRKRLHEPLPVQDDCPGTYMRREPGEQMLHCARRNECLSVPARKQWWHCSCPAGCEHYTPLDHEQEMQDMETLTALASVIVQDRRRA